MWKLNTFEGEKIFYEQELIEKIKTICKDTCCIQKNCERGCYGCRHIDETTAIKRILELIEENERR